MVFIFNNNEFNSIKSMEGHVMIWFPVGIAVVGFIFVLGIAIALMMEDF